MDRLHLVIVALLLCPGAGCKDSDSKNAPSSGRVNAVQGQAQPEREADPAGFCDVYRADGGPRLELPELAQKVSPSPEGSWRWINLWATWCEPCVEELPRLESWSARLDKAGVPIDLVLVSVDEDSETVETFVAEHRGFADSGRVADPESVSPFLVSAGLDEGAPLPVHIVVDPAGTIRCLRSGAVADRDYPSAAAVFDR